MIHCMMWKPATALTDAVVVSKKTIRAPPPDIDLATMNILMNWQADADNNHKSACLNDNILSISKIAKLITRNATVIAG